MDRRRLTTRGSEQYCAVMGCIVILLASFTNKVR